MAIDVQLLVQTLVYFAGVLSGLAAVIPLGLTSMNFDGNCILYGTVDWEHSTYTFGSRSVCNFPIYLLVFGCIIYGAAMGGYHMYALCASRNDPTKGSEMWVMPFLMINTSLTVVLFIACCLVSIGFATWCNSLVNGAKDSGRTYITKCSDGQEYISWSVGGKKSDASTFNTFLSTAQTAIWICFLTWLGQEALSILRLCRNRRIRSSGHTDNQVIANVEPTA